jgi:hypothetical protein
MASQIFIFRYNTVADYTAPTGLTSAVAYQGTTSGQAIYNFTRPIGWNHVDVLVVAGGGSGGYGAGAEGGGGGGAGGFQFSKGQTLADDVITIKVGNGGIIGENGVNSAFNTITSIGGGRGGLNGGANVGGNGGSGGGARGAGADQLGGIGTVGQGKNGGYAYWQSGGSGGGGAATDGLSGGTAQIQNIGGNGGSGNACNISGTLQYYAGGGGGGAVNTSGTIGTGGLGGGANGAGNGAVNGTNASVNTGGGGGGSTSYSVVASAAPGTGGSGIVIVRLRKTLAFPIIGGPINCSTVRQYTNTTGTGNSGAISLSQKMPLLYSSLTNVSLSSFYGRGFQPTSGNKWVIGSLDFLSTSQRPNVAFALRRLYASYSGPQIRICRGTDNIEADVYFDAVGTVVRLTLTGAPQTSYTSWSTWLNGANALLTAWFDQSGNAFHMSVVNSPTVEYFGGNLCIKLNGTTQYGECNGTVSGSIAASVGNLGMSGNAQKTVITEAVVEENGSNLAGLFDLGDTGIAGQHFCLRLNASFVAWRSQFWGAADFDFNFDGRNNMVTYTTTHDGSITAVYADSVLQGSKSNVFTTGGSRPFEMGRYGGGNYFGGRIRSYIVMNRGVSQTEVNTFLNSN